MSTQTLIQTSQESNVEPEAIYLSFGCISLCMLAIALALKFRSVAEAVALLS
jgi:hypothetical protein